MHDEAGTASREDAEERERALDVTQSFLVQAPAGSGKTELLIQRYLALLARVDRPERIVAMTFTKKAAGEMRERIVAALRAAEAETNPPSPAEPRTRELAFTPPSHDERTRELARAALAQDARHGWRIIAHPARLAVSTIDALAAALARQAPVSTGLGVAPRYEEHAAPLYAKAARATLAAARADDSAWRRLLAHLDNDADATVRLIAEMLAKRDQWLRELDAANRGRFRARLEATLAAEIEGEIAQALAAFPPALADALREHERYAATTFAAAANTAERARDLEACATSGGLPGRAVADAPAEGGRALSARQWHSLANWLLVARDAHFRARVNPSDGFPAIGRGAQAPARKERNRAMQGLLLDLAAVPGLAEALHAVRQLANAHYTDETWAIVDALLDVLPQASAMLAVIFGERGAIDFAQGTLAALAALGDGDAPTDLLLRLDLRLAHVLVDEFQDTSFTQLDLIERLTAGWEAGDGRTIFAVGDPMQSIYRFRGAEVRLFVEAQQSGRIGALPVQNLVLHRNFRSQRGLVEWVNAAFPGVLGARSDPWRGTVGFVPSVAVHEALPIAAATLDVASDGGHEAQIVVDRVRTALAEGGARVAILVRARSHLALLLPALRTAGIAYDGVELDALAERQTVIDLVSLTHALIQPDDRLAWLSVLRAPWCGLVLDDLHAIVAAADARPDRSIAGLIHATQTGPKLSPDGCRRFARIVAALAPAQGARGRAGLAARVRGAWLALGGAACVEEPSDLDAAEHYLALLALHEAGDDVHDWPAFIDALELLYAEPAANVETAERRVQVMTLHRAKGLEFDTVIMPGLAQGSNRDSAEILRWRRRPSGLMVAPMKARGGTDDSIYTYLGILAQSEESAELARLLYVGTTRARRRLHLTAVLKSKAGKEGSLAWEPPPAGSALARFWEAVRAGIAPPLTSSAVIPATPPRYLARVPAGWRPPAPSPAVPVVASVSRIQDTVPFDWARETAKHSGTVAHRLFAQIARERLDDWTPVRVARLDTRIRTELSGEGVDDADLGAAAANVATMLTRMLGDERGRWLVDRAHADARSEWALAGVDGDAAAHVVLDRSFVAGGVRWIVDFKTGVHEGGDIAAFLDAEVERYRGQLERYARFVRALDARPIRLAIYFPMHGGWREWPYEG